MKKSEINKQYLNKIKLINKFNKFYFNKNKPLVSDEVYDNLKKQIIELENQYTFLKSKNSPSIVVGHRPSKNFKKASHKVPMLSLSNAFSEDDLLNFEKKNFKFSFKERRL